MMNRTTTWSNIGVEAKGQNLDNLLSAADLDYTVILSDLFTEVGGQKILVPNKKVTMREDTNQVFGVVSDRYQICQNRDALDFVNYIENIELLKAGSYANGGGYSYLISQLPEVKVLGDEIRPHLIFQTSHDGSSSVKATICMLRIACQNQFVHAFKDSPATIKITHSGNMGEKLQTAQATMLQVHDYVQHFEQQAEYLAGKKITPQTFNRVLERFFVTNPEWSDRWNQKVEEQKDYFIQAYNADDNQNFKGTRWGLVNAYADFITHDEPIRKTNNWEDSKFFGSLNSAPMDQFLEYVTI